MDKRNSGRTFTAEGESQLLQFLFEVCKGQSRTSVKSYLTRHQVTVNGQVVTAYNFQLRKGDKVCILGKSLMVKKRKGEEDTRVKILYEDDWIIAVDKRSGLLTMSTGKEGEVTAYSLITSYVKRLYGHDSRIFIVHRIDRDTSGVILFAKDEETKAKLQQGWNENILERKYVAVLQGVPQENEGTLRSWLKEHPKTLKVYSCEDDGESREAVTHYKVLSSGRHYSLVEFNLETGRKHQIRVHASDMGCPVLGDRRYGSTENPLKRVALHARTISFRHPVTGKMMKFDTGVPYQFKATVEEDNI